MSLLMFPAFKLRELMAPPHVINRGVFEAFLEVDNENSRNVSKDLIKLYFSQADKLINTIGQKLCVYPQIVLAFVITSFRSQNRIQSCDHEIRTLNDSASTFGIVQVEECCQKLESAFYQSNIVGAEQALLNMKSLLVDLRLAHSEAKRYLAEWYGI
jgi:HPt (histidine-containing phosphotransfer) domain-containing protein